MKLMKGIVIMENKFIFVCQEIYIQAFVDISKKEMFEVYLETGTEFKKALHRRFLLMNESLVYTEKLRMFVIDNIMSYLKSLDPEKYGLKNERITKIGSIQGIELMKDYNHRVGFFNFMLSNVAAFYDSYLFYESKFFLR